MLIFFLACTDWATLCRENDPSVKPSQCWGAGREVGYQDGYYSAYNASYEAVLNECEALSE